MQSCYNRFLDLSAQESRGSDDEDVEEEGETDAIRSLFSHFIQQHFKDYILLLQLTSTSPTLTIS